MDSLLLKVLDILLYYELKRIDITDPGINYDPTDNWRWRLMTGDNGAKASLCKGVGAFGKIERYV